MTSPELTSLNGLERIWTEPGITQHFDPLVDTAFWIEKKLWGAAPLGYHLVSITCHVGMALLLVKLLRRLQIKGAWFAAAIFALHPVHVESVAWISELKNTLSGVFFLGTILAYLRFDESRTLSSYAVAMGLFVPALLGKTTAVVWPIGMLAILWWKRGTLSWTHDLLPLIPFVALALLDGWVALGVERHATGDTSVDLSFSTAQRLVIAGRACWFYLGKLLWPVGLCPIYPRWHINDLTRIDGLYPLGFLVLLAGLWIARQPGRAPSAAFLFFVGALSPLLGIFSFAYQRHSFVADHFQYLASLGVITLVAGGSVWLQDRWRLFPRSAGIGLCVALLAMLAVLTREHARAYADLGAFARTTLAANPTCWAAHDDLGLVLMSDGKVAEAMDQFHLTLRANPRYGLGHYHLGSALQTQGRTEEAIEQYRLAIQLRPDLIRPRYNLGCILASQGKIPEAIQQYQEALRREPYVCEVHNNLGIALASSGKLDEAMAQFRRAIELRPDFAEAHVNLGHALANRNQFAEAIQQYEEALQFDPNNAGDHYDLAIGLANSGDLVQATDQFRQAARIDPDLPDVHSALARVLELRGLHDEAQRESAEEQRHALPAPKESPEANSASAR
jgi:tetratricopeptide (TPR) repeat protein